MTAGYLSSKVFSRYAFANSGVSEEADRLAKATKELQLHCERPESLYGRKAEAINRLYAAVDELRVDVNQEPAVPEAMLNATKFLRILPNEMRLPDIGVEPDGSISLDWIVSRTCMLSISISTSDRLAFAWLNGSDRGHAVAYFRGGLIPEPLFSVMRSLIPNDSITLRAA